MRAVCYARSLPGRLKHPLNPVSFVPLAELAQLWQSLLVVSRDQEAISIQEHDGPGTAAIVDHLILIWAQGCPGGDDSASRRLALAARWMRLRRAPGASRRSPLVRPDQPAVANFRYGSARWDFVRLIAGCSGA